MNNMFSSKRRQTFLAGLILLVSFSSFIRGDDHFAIAINPQGSLVIYGPKGEQAATLPAPSVSHPVTVGSTSFQVSYGRDANDLLTAILAPSSSDPQDLHFTVLSKSIDTDKQAVITLTFSPGLGHVTVDPGYIGTVTVNSHTIKHHEMAENTYSPSPAYDPPSAPVPRTTADIAPRDLPPVATDDYTPSNSYEPSASASDPTSDLATAPGLSTGGAPLMAPRLIGGLSNQPPPPYSLNSSPTSGGGGAAPGQKLFWSEPVTPLNGPAPSVSLNEMKLVQVQGPVSLRLANGDTRDGEEGMIVPAGATVMTSSNSSAAIFMGGVNSARLMPNCELRVSQNLSGSVRRTRIDLVHGAVFSRIGHRPGETQDYEVRTPEGVAAARGTEMLTYCGNLDNLENPSTTMNSGVGSGRLLAWSPASLEHGVLSDVANPMLAVAATNPNSLYVFVAKGSVECSINGVVYQIVSGGGGAIGSSVMPPSSDPQTTAILNAILKILQPFNTELTQIIADINNGTATPQEQALYDELSLATNSLGEFAGYLGPRPNEGNVFEDYPNFLRILFPFGTKPLTQGEFIPSD